MRISLTSLEADACAEDVAEVVRLVESFPTANAHQVTRITPPRATVQ